VRQRRAQGRPADFGNAATGHRPPRGEPSVGPRRGDRKCGWRGPVAPGGAGWHASMCLPIMAA